MFAIYILVPIIIFLMGNTLSTFSAANIMTAKNIIFAMEIDGNEKRVRLAKLEEIKKSLRIVIINRTIYISILTDLTIFLISNK